MIVRETGDGSFPQAPTGVEPARCYGVIDIGSHTSELYGRTARQVVLMFELTDARIDEGEHAGEPYRMSQFYNASLHEKAKLRKHLESWRGREFTPAELGGFDLKNLLDIQVNLNLVSKEQKTRIDGLLATRKGEKFAPLIAQPLYFNLDAFDAAVFAILPEWLQKNIQESPEYKKLNGKMAAPAQAAEWNGDIDDGSEIPF